MTADTEEPLYETSRWLGIEYDITKALELTDGRVDGELSVTAWAPSTFAATNPTDLLDPNRAISLLTPYVDVAYALGRKPEYGDVDLTRPLLVCVETSPDGTPFGKVIDGRHRLYRAWTDGVSKLPATVLTDDERAQVRRNLVDPGDR